MDLCVFKASLVYKVCSRPARVTERPCLKKKRKGGGGSVSEKKTNKNFLGLLIRSLRV